MMSRRAYRRERRDAVEAIYALEGELAAVSAVDNTFRHPVRCPRCKGVRYVVGQDRNACFVCRGTGLLVPHKPPVVEEDLFEDHARPCFTRNHSGFYDTVISCAECRAAVGLAPQQVEMLKARAGLRKQHPNSAGDGSGRRVPKHFGR